MNCSHCQREIAEYSNYCYFCGARQAPKSVTAGKRLMRSSTDCKIAGVCGGIAEYFEVDSTVVRIVWVLLVLMPVPVLPAFLGYIVAWIVMPKAARPVAAPDVATPAAPPVAHTG